MKFVVLVFLYLSLKAQCGTQVFEGVAKKQGQVIYYENHLLIYKEGRPLKSFTEYYDPKGDLIASLTTDYSEHVGAPNFLLIDKNNKSVQGFQWEGDKVELFGRTGPKDKLHIQRVKPKGELILNAPGLTYFVAQNLEKLIKKNKCGFKFLIPGGKKAIDFEISLVALSTYEAVFDVKTQSWFMRIFGPSLRLVFDRLKKRPRVIEGLSNLRDSNGEMMSVDIEYQYEN